MSCALWSQEDLEITSFYLEKIPEQAAKPIKSIASKHQGDYILTEDSLKSIQVYADSIILSKIVMFTVTDKGLSDNKDWYVDAGRLYGIQKNKGLPFIRSNDTLYAALILESALWKKGDNNGVFQSGNIIRLFKDADRYISFYKITFGPDKLTVSNFNHDPIIGDIETWKSVRITKKNGFKTYIAQPTKREFEALIHNQKAFEDSKVYSHSTAD